MRTLTILTSLLVLVCSGILAAGPATVDASQSAVISSPTGSESRSLIQFDLSSFQNKSVEYAAIDLEFTPPQDSCERYQILIVPVASSWNENTGWSTGWSDSGGDYSEEEGLVATVARKRGYKTRVLLTEFAKQWVTGMRNNYGFMVLCLDPAPDKAELASAVSHQLEIRTSN